MSITSTIAGFPSGTLPLSGNELVPLWQPQNAAGKRTVQVPISQLITGLIAFPIAINKGGTGAITAAQALINLGAIGSANPSFTGTVTLPDATTWTSALITPGVALNALFASPPAIGATAAAAGSFTTLSASSTVSGAGVTSLFASPPAIGATAAAAGAFTTLSSSSSAVITGTATAAMAAGTLALQGVSTAPTFGANGEGAAWLTAAGGLNIGGQGSTNDVVVRNSAGSVTLAFPTGTLTTAAQGAITVSGTTTPTMASGVLALQGISTFPTFGANGEGAISLSATSGIVIGGKGSTNDITINNSAGAVVFRTLTGTTGGIFTGKVEFDIVDQHDVGLTLLSSAPTTTNGTIWNDSTQKTLGSYENGLIIYKSGYMYSAAATVVTAGTGANSLLSATAVGTLTLPANFLLPGKVIHIRVMGSITTTGSPGTVTMTAALGGTAVCTNSGAPNTPTASLAGVDVTVDIFMTCQTAGSSGTVYANGFWAFQGGANNMITSAAPTTINTTTTQAITLSSTNSVGGGSVLTISTAIVEVIG